MKLILLITIALSLPTLAATKKKKVTVVEKPKTEERVEQFSELKLQGALKRPELNYRFEDEMSQELKPIEVPRNFDHELVQDIERR